jgi:hypothetical protein
MDTMQGFLLAVAWFLLRFGLPLIGTILVCWFFKRLDARWQEEAEVYKREKGFDHRVPVTHCWLFSACSEEKREKCPAYQNQNIPCWQHFRNKNGELKDNCIGCIVFRGAPPLPTIGD